MKPKAKFQAGAISCAIWENNVVVGDRDATMLKCTVERRYKDSDGEWQSSGSFGRNDIPLVQHVLAKAYAYIIEHGKNGGDDNE